MCARLAGNLPWIKNCSLEAQGDPEAEKPPGNSVEGGGRVRGRGKGCGGGPTYWVSAAVTRSPWVKAQGRKG